jgi:effector-binding domain-containing protein
VEVPAAVPVDAAAKVPVRYRVMQLESGTAVKATHKGSYKTLEEPHNKLNQYLAWRKLEVSGAPWEVYITEPEGEKDTARWVTEVYYPVRK